MAGYIGNIPVPQALRNYDVFTATSGQTVFNVKSYDPSFIDVYQNGVKLIDGDDYTATDGNTVVLASGATLNDIVEVISFTTFYPADVVSASAGGTFFGAVSFDADVTPDSDATYDLGSSSKAWAEAYIDDLYLSGGVYVGGTGSANYLDDYEEGAWQPAAGANSGLAGTFSTYSGSYVKVGKLVFVKFLISGTSMSWSSTAAYLTLTNLPFTSSANSHGGFTNTSGTFGTVNGDVFSSGSTLILTAEWGSGSANSIIGSCVYEAT